MKEPQKFIHPSSEGERPRSRVIIIKITPEGLDRVDKIAERDGVTLNDCLTNVIEAGVEALENNPSKKKD